MNGLLQLILRWRMESDNSVSGEGWRIDNVDIAELQLAARRATPVSTPASDATPNNAAVINDHF